MANYRYDYYSIDIPSDVTEDRRERADMAIDQAREQAKLYVIPCSWEVRADDGNTVQVRRKRFAKS